MAAGAAVVTVLAGCTGAPAAEPPTSAAPSGSASASEQAPDDLSAFYSQRVRWRGCGGGFDCTTVKVPLDYADPGAASIELDVVRLKARNPQGSLLLNPGGPGGSGVDYARAARAVLTPQVVKAFDVVGFDPRGVAGSTPVDCLDDARIDTLLAADGTPDDQAEIDELVALARELGEGCKARSGELAARMDTIAAVRDMDILRAVLGDEKMNFLGKSYGTLLGSTYADLFPERVGRFVLDGVLPNSLDSDEVSFGQAKAFDVALRRFVADCITREDCPLPRDEDAGVERIQQFIDGLDATPLPGVGDRQLTQALGTYAIVSYLYMPPTDWDVLRFGLASAFDGDGSVLMDMMDERVQRNPDGTFANNGNEAFYAISCLDRPALGGADHAKELATQWAGPAPVFGPYLAWGTLACDQWPWPGPGPGALEPITAEGAGPILVVSTKYDPATPYEWGVQVADELDNATLLTYDGDGHTAYTSGSSCIDRAVDAYLLSGTMPAEGTVCRADADGSGTGV